MTVDSAPDLTDLTLVALTSWAERDLHDVAMVALGNDPEDWPVASWVRFAKIVTDLALDTINQWTDDPDIRLAVLAVTSFNLTGELADIVSAGPLTR